MKGLISSMVLCGMSLATAQAALINYTDGTFAVADWSTTVYQTGASTSSSQEPSGGNPGAYRQTSHTVAGGNKIIYVFHENLNAVYDPSTLGVINSIDYALDYRVFSSSGAVAWDFALEQDGTIYHANSTYWFDVLGSWTTQSTNGLVASDFAIWAGGGGGETNPDFSTSGAPITLGYLSINSSTSGGFTMTFGTDNFSSTVDHAAIPEPGTLALFGLAGSAIIGLRRLMV